MSTAQVEHQVSVQTWSLKLREADYLLLLSTGDDAWLADLPCSCNVSEFPITARELKPMSAPAFTKVYLCCQ